MNKFRLPAIQLDAKPKGLTFNVPASAAKVYDAAVNLKAPADRDIAILGDIGDEQGGGFSAGMMRAALKTAGRNAVTVVMNSRGGDAYEGIAIYNLLREHPAPVTVQVIGLAASAASLIAMAGDRVEMSEGASIMIHSAWGMVVGNRKDMREFAEYLDAIDADVAQIYARRTGKPVPEILEMMAKETRMNGADAVRLGFADVALAPEDKKAKARANPVYISARPQPALFAASGDRQRLVVRLSDIAPGVTGKPDAPIPKDANMRTVAEQIQSFENKRAANLARVTEIQNKAIEDGRSKDDAEKQEFDALMRDNETVDSELVDLRAMEKQIVAHARPVTPAVNTDNVVQLSARGGPAGTITVRPNVEPGIAFTRFVKAMALSKGNLSGALAYAQANQQWRDQTPEVGQVLLAAVAAGDTTTATWAAELVYKTNLASAFLEYLRPMTLLGKITGFTKVPFNVRWASQTSGSTTNWVGEGKPIPVSKYLVGEGELGMLKAAGLIVLTKELVMSSSPDAEVLTRNELAASMAQFLDARFIAPDYAAVANVSPASVTNDVTPTPPTGTNSAALRTDVQTLFGVWIAANVDPSTGVWIMTPTTALAISLMLNALGQPVFPGITMNGGTFFGLPVVVSNNAKQVGSPVTGEGNLLVLLNAKDIVMADEGGLAVDASAEASIEMLDNPTNQSVPTVTPTTSVSMWQTNSVALRAIRYINWSKRRSTAVAYIKDAAYVS